MNPKSPDISIIIPVFNEADSIKSVHEELLEKLNLLCFEIIYVDDGSTDGTDKLLAQFCRTDPERTSCIVLYGRNGKASAQEVGIAQAKGKFIVFMDGDGQDDPMDIIHLLTSLEKENADMVVGWRKKRRSTAFYRSISKIFNLVIRMLIGLNIRDINASLKITRSQFLKEIPIYAGHYRFLPILLHKKGLKVIEKQIHHRKRIAGISKYTPFKAIGGGLDMLTIFFLMYNNLNPLRFFGGIGLALIGPGLLICFYITSLKLIYGHILSRYPLLLLGILLLLTGMQFMCTGLLGELLVYSHAKHHPLPFIRTVMDTCRHSGAKKDQEI